MTPAPADDRVRGLVDRVRALLADGHVREVRMFGAIAVMVDDALAVAVHKDGSLLARVDPAESARLLDTPGVSRADGDGSRSLDGRRVDPGRGEGAAR